jgi:hypothetical protein
MATIDPTITEGDAYSISVEWTLGPDDDGTPVRFGGAADRTVQMIGVFGGAIISIQGTLEEVPTTWAVLTDVQGDAITKTAASIGTITELVKFIRPVVTGGAGTDVKVLMLMRPTR